MSSTSAPLDPAPIDPPGDARVQPRSSRRARRRTIGGVLALLAVAAVAGFGLTRSDAPGEQVAIQGRAASVVFTEPKLDDSGRADVTTGAVELRRSDGTAVLAGEGRMVTDATDPSRNRLTVEPEGDWNRPLGIDGLDLADPRVATIWDADADAFTGTVSGRPVGPKAAELEPIPVRKVQGPDGSSADLPAAPAVVQTVQVDLDRDAKPAVRSKPASLGPMDLGPLHADDVTISVETAPDGSQVTVLGLHGVSGALGPVAIVDADGEVRLGEGMTSADLALSGTMRIGEQTGPFEVTAPVEIDGKTIVIGPDAHLEVPLGTGLVVDATLSLTTAPKPGQPLVVADARATYGSLEVAVHGSIGSGPDGFTAEVALTEPLAVGGGLTVDEASLAWNGSTLRVSGQGRLTSAAGTDLAATVAGTLSLGKDGGAPTFDLTTAAEGRLALAGTTVGLDGGLHLTGTLGGAVELDGSIVVADTTVAVKGRAQLDGGTIDLSLRATRPGTTATVDLRIDRDAGTVSGDLALDHLAVAGFEVDDVELAVDHGPKATKVDVAVGRLQLPSGRSVSVSGSLVAEGGTVSLSVDGTTDLLGPTITVGGTVELADGRLDVDLTAAGGTEVALGGRSVELGGRIHLSGNALDELAIEADLELAGTHIDATGTLALDDGSLVLALTGTGPGASGLQLDARYDLGAKTLEGTATLESWEFGGIELTRAELGISLGSGTDTITIEADAALGDTTTVHVEGRLALGDGKTRLDAEGQATINGVEVEVAGWLELAPDAKPTFDVKATATNVKIPFGGQDLVLGGALRLHGTVGGPIDIEATVEVYGRTIEVTGTLTTTDDGLTIVLDATDGAGTLHAEVTVADGAVSGTVDIDRLELGDVVVTDAHLEITSKDGVIDAALTGTVTWRDGTLEVSGRVTRSADGALQVTLDAEGALPLGAGVTVNEVHLAYDGTTISLDGKARILTAKVDATVAVTGTVTLGDSPTFALQTDAAGTVALDDEERLAFTGSLSLRNGTGLQVLIDGTLETLDQKLAFTGSLGLEDGKVVVALANTSESTVTFSLDLTVDIAARSGSGHLKVADLRLGTLQIERADVSLELADGRLAARIAGKARFGETLSVELDAEVVVADGRTTLRFTGLAQLLDRFVDVGVTGTAVLEGGQVSFDITADAAASLDFTGKGDLFVDAGFRVHGTIGQPIAIEGDVEVLENRVAFAGTFEATSDGATLTLREAPGSTTTFALDAKVGADGVTATVAIGTAKIDVLTVSDLTLDVTIAADRSLTATIAARAQLADPEGRLAGVTEADAAIAGTFTRSAEGADDLTLRATIERLKTTGKGTGATIDDLRLDYLDVKADISRAAEGQPTTAKVTATIAATKVGDTYALPDDAAAAGNARIDLTGTLTLNGDGKIQAWKLDGKIDRLTYKDKITVSGTFSAHGEGLDGPVSAEIDGDIVAMGGKVDGQVAGAIGYQPGGGLIFDLTGKVNVRKVAGIDAALDLRITGAGLLTVDGPVAFGPLNGTASGKVELMTLPNGTTWPRLDLQVDTWFASAQAANVFEGRWVSHGAAAFLNVSLTNWDHPDTYEFRARGMGGGAVSFVAGLGQGAGLAGLNAEGTFRDIGGKPSFDLEVRAAGAGGAQVLGFLWMGAGGAATLDVHGDFEHVKVDGRALAVAVVGVGPIPLPVGAGMDVSFQADLTGDKTYEVSAVAHAGVSILGPVITADADVRLTGTVDLARKQADFHAEAKAQANVLLIVAKGKAKGTVDLHVDWATPDAPAVVTGTARVDIDARVVFWRVAGFHADLRFDGEKLWITNGDKFLSGDGLINRQRRVVNLRGTMWPEEKLCGDRQVKKRFGGWKGDGSWGDCGGQGSATGRVVMDSDGSGTASAGDVGLAGVSVQLQASDGSPIGSIATQVNGSWRFDDLGSGVAYKIVVGAPAGRTLVAEADGTTDGQISVTGANGAVTETGTMVMSGDPEPTDPTAGITGTVAEDRGGDGSTDGDPMFRDVTIRVSGPASTTSRTGADGRWAVSGLPSGTYLVEVVRPTYTTTADPDGTVDGRFVVQLADGQVTDVGTFGLHADGLPEAPTGGSEMTEGVTPAPDPTPSVPLTPTDPSTTTLGGELAPTTPAATPRAEVPSEVAPDGSAPAGAAPDPAATAPVPEQELQPAG